MISKIKYYTAFILVFLFNIPVYAAPNGANVVYGDVNISQSGSNTVINQNTDKAIINWNSFDVNKGESVLFNQNSSSSIILNRVTSGLPTNIFGNISANGNVFILNQAGVLVGNGAQINTNSFLAGAASINDKDFLAGKHNFYGAQGNVINNGSIKVQDGGYAVLMGKKVENNGLISAKFGKIYLSSGETFRMDMSGNDLIGVAVEKGITDAYISNAGHIQSEGGTIVMTAKNASDVIRHAVNNLASLTLNAGGGITGNNSIIAGEITANALNKILLTKLDITGKSSYISSNGDVNLVGDNIGLITNIKGHNVSVEVTKTGSGISMDTSVTSDKAAVTGQEVVLKADGAVNISVDTKKLSAESINNSLDITNLNRNETVLDKYFGNQTSTYTQDTGIINLSYIPKNAIGQDLTIKSTYGTVKAVDRLDALKQYAGLKIDVNTIHFIENNSNLLTLDSSFLGNKKADKYIFETNGNINVDLGSMSKDLLQSGVELISRNGAITSISDISAMYFSANALNDINVTSYLLGGISLESASGSINYTHKAGPISIKALKALNGNINVNLVGTSGGSSIPGVTLPPDFNIGDLYIFGLESKNPVNITTQNANVISIAGNGATALTLNITNNNTNPYKLEISNNYNITLNTSNTQFSEIKLSSNNGNLYFPVTNNTLTAVDKIYLSANHINGDSKNLKLLAKDVYVNQKSGSNSFIIDAERADINGSELYITFVKDTQLADINKDDYAVSGGSINIMSDYDVIQQNKVYASNVNIAADSFTFDSIDSSVIHGNNISINAKGDISGYGKIIADKVYLSGSTISSASNLLVLADYGHFISTAVNKPANDILININSDDWFDNLKSYKFETYGNGLSYLNGKLVDYKIYDMVKNVYTRNLQPIENTNIDKVTGDDLIKGGRLQDTSELVTIEDNKTPKVNNITKKNKSIELK